MTTKFSKSFTTWFFPVGDDIRQIVVDWVDYLRKEKLWGLDDPLFPATKIVVGDTRQFEVSGTRPQALEQRRPNSEDFQERLRGRGLPYFNPHSFRKTGASRRPNLQVPGGIQGVDPKSRPRKRPDNIFELRRCWRQRQAEIIRGLGNR